MKVKLRVQKSSENLSWLGLNRKMTIQIPFPTTLWELPLSRSHRKLHSVTSNIGNSHFSSYLSVTFDIIEDFLIPKTFSGIPGWRSGLAPAFGPGRDPGDPGSSPMSGSRCMEPASPSAYVSASLSLSL